MWFVHFLSFSHNSLLDSCIISEKGELPPDFRDSNKSHHPLIKGDISIRKAKTVILWGMGLLAISLFIFTYLFAENFGSAVSSLFFYLTFGTLYNEGLSKESLFGFLPISICFTCLGAWGWFLSHTALTITGLLYMGYLFCTILFQISFSGHLKEMEVKERSNILIKMGATMDGPKFVPGRSRAYAWFVKGINVLLGFLLLLQNYSQVRLVAYLFFALVITFYLHQLTKTRIYDRDKELLKMSLMEIATIYLPITLLLGLSESLILMVVGVVYFFLINLWIWKKPFPHV